MPLQLLIILLLVVTLFLPGMLGMNDPVLLVLLGRLVMLLMRIPFRLMMML